jgi:dCMP deaminase
MEALREQVWCGPHLACGPCSSDAGDFQRCRLQGKVPPTLEEFVIQNDAHLYDPIRGLAVLIDRAEVRLMNSTSSIEALHRALESLNLTDDQRLRPSWDQYFMQLASLAAQRSNCMKRRVGCVLVREKRVISTGYNGTSRHLRNCNEGGCMSSLAVRLYLLRKGTEELRRQMQRRV